MLVKLKYESQAQFENEIVSLRTMKKVDEKYRVQLLDRVDSVKTVMKAGDERRIQVRKKIQLR